MEKSEFVKCEPAWPPDTEDEPSNFENVELALGMIPVKQETRSELPEPGATQENTFETSADIKDELFLEERAVNQLLPCIGEENSLENCAVHHKERNSTFSLKTNHETPPSLHSHECDKTFRLKTTCGKTYRLKTIHVNNVVNRTRERPQRYIVFTQKCRSKNRIRNHSAEHRYLCNECGKTFPQKSEFTRHMRAHSGERPHPCSKCGKAFSEKSGLLKHMRTHTGELSHFCNECGKSFSRKSVLSIHKRIHSGERPHNCNVCGRSCSQKSDLKRHMLTHSGERPLSCNECGRTFARKQVLRRHLLTHSQEQPTSSNENGR